MIIFLILYCVTFKLFKKYWSRWLFWAGSIIAIAALTAHTPEEGGFVAGQLIALLGIFTVIRWVISWLRYLYSNHE